MEVVLDNNKIKIWHDKLSNKSNYFANSIDYDIHKLVRKYKG